MDYLPFDSRNKLYKTPFGATDNKTPVVFRLLLSDSQKCGKSFLRIRNDCGNYEYYELAPSEASDNGYRFFTVSVTLVEGLYFYDFCFDSEQGRQYVTRFSGGKGHISPDGAEWQLTVCKSTYKTPDKYRGGIIYQIFPDRFNFSGVKKDNIPNDRYFRGDWLGTPEHRQTGCSRTLGNDYFGGDIKGITAKLDYLESLGVNIIYLNPIFEAHSNHRYNTADYEKIDPMLGTEADLTELCSEAKKHGISVILDGVFSHTGEDSIYFNKYKRYGDGGAYNSAESEYFGWFKFQDWPKKYSSWWGIESLPETDEENPSYRKFITGESGVLRKWMKCGVSGWRLDVADELPDGFIDSIRTAVKAEDPEALLIGEVWEDASNKVSYGHRRRYLRGDQLDSVMNYPFADAVIGFLVYGNGSAFTESVMSICENYPKQALNLLMNHVGTHDTVRVLTALGGIEPDGRGRDWQSVTKMDGNTLYLAKKRLYLAAVLQYTLPGIPSLYYGDEAGIEGYGDPFCRSCYPWGNEDRYLLEFYKKLGQFRRSCTAFADGLFLPVASGENHVSYIRQSKNESVFVSVNRSFDQIYSHIPPGWENAETVFGYLPDNQTVKTDPLGFTVLKLNRK